MNWVHLKSNAKRKIIISWWCCQIQTDICGKVLISNPRNRTFRTTKSRTQRAPRLENVSLSPLLSITCTRYISAALDVLKNYIIITSTSNPFFKWFNTCHQIISNPNTKNHPINPWTSITSIHQCYLNLKQQFEPQAKIKILSLFS